MNILPVKYTAIFHLLFFDSLTLTEDEYSSDEEDVEEIKKKGEESHAEIREGAYDVTTSEPDCDPHLKLSRRRRLLKICLRIKGCLREGVHLLC